MNVPSRARPETAKFEREDVFGKSWYEHRLFPLALILLVVILWTAWVYGIAAWTRSELERHTATKHDLKLLWRAKADPALRPNAQPSTPSETKQNEYVRADEARAANLSELGQAGDAFGGFNAFFASLAGAAVVWAGALQYKTLTRTTAAYQRERSNILYDQTQSIFFNILHLAQAELEKITYSEHQLELRGGPALDVIAKIIVSATNRNTGDFNQVLHFALIHYKQQYDQQAARIGPYWRLLFQAFQTVDSADITPEQKLRLSKIARGQVSEGTALLLALNGLTPYGWPFAYYIEEYGLLEHLHPDYLEIFKPALETVYQPHAFLGSKARLAREKTPEASLLALDHYANPAYGIK